MLAGKLLAAAAVYDGKNAVQTQSYGPEARGGKSKTDVVISNGEIDYPKATEVDVLLAMSQASLDEYLPSLRDGGILVLGTLFGKFPFLKKLFADGGYQGPVFKQAQKKTLPHLETEIVKRSDVAVGFEIIPRRWVVERTFAWLGRCRRLAKDFENRTRTARAFLILASIRLMTRKLCLIT